ncbi:hypothetical protein [Sediminitomix flava]|uniref:Lipoprotein n=1 Tax=Sediminitomix flava TaxID=379075 RepID=A0A315ZGQ6_SEDFL|nr:hypothetical protein [Sediminitomix flava]PWJ44349.1 hypothetical protein BC781_101699 [Sediminitomix flava]
MKLINTLGLSFIIVTSVLLTSCFDSKQEQKKVDSIELKDGADISSEGEKTRGKYRKKLVKGKEFNACLPNKMGDYKITYTQEKLGMIQAVVSEKGDDVATITVADLLDTPQNIEKYTSSTQDLKGYPMLSKGSKGTAILVSDRFQVQVRSKSDSFTEADRIEVLSQVDLNHLAQLN